MCTSSHGRNYASSCVLRDTHTHTHTDNHASLLAWFWRGVLERSRRASDHWFCRRSPFSSFWTFFSRARMIQFSFASSAASASNGERRTPPQRRSNSFLFAVLLRDQLERDQRVSLDWLIVWWAHEISVVYCIFFIYFFLFDILSSLFELNFNYFRILNFRLRVNHWFWKITVIFSLFQLHETKKTRIL